MPYRLVPFVLFVLLTYGQPVHSEDSPAGVLESGYELPDGFSSIQQSKQPGTGRQQLDAIYENPAEGSRIRFTTVRGAVGDAEPGSEPIDVCVRDEKTGNALGAQISGHPPLIDGCSWGVGDRHGDDQVLRAVQSLQRVKFKSEYRAEYDAIVSQAARIEWQRKMAAELSDSGPGVHYPDEKTGKPVPVKPLEK